MDTSRLSNSLHFQRVGVSPKKSPAAASIQKRRKDLERSQRAAYWALLNTFMAVVLYYDLCYLKVLNEISSVLTNFEWLVCAVFTISAFYDYGVHFWPHTIMRPIMVTSAERRLHGIQEDEMGFQVRDPPAMRSEPVYDNMPPFEIHYSFEEDEQVVTPTKKPLSPDSSKINTSERTKIVDKESLVEYLKNCQVFEDEMAELREADIKQNHF